MHYFYSKIIKSPSAGGSAPNSLGFRRLQPLTLPKCSRLIEVYWNFGPAGINKSEFI